MKGVYIVYHQEIVRAVCSNLLTAYESLKNLIPIHHSDYLKSYETCSRNMNKLKQNFECMTPTGYYVIKEHKVMQRKNAKPDKIG